MFTRFVALLATGEVGLLKQRAKTALVAYAAGALAAFAALVFLLLAAYLAAADRWGMTEAAAWFGIGFVVLTALILIAYRIIDGAQRRRQERKRAAEVSTLAGASALAMLPTLLRKPSGTAALLAGLAALAGYAAYREFERQPDDKAPAE